MDLKGQLQATLASGKFEDLTFNVKARDSRLHVTVQATGSIDLPGELDSVVAEVVGLLQGKSKSDGGA